jgi:hypothetical protein
MVDCSRLSANWLGGHPRPDFETYQFRPNATTAKSSLNPAIIPCIFATTARHLVGGRHSQRSRTTDRWGRQIIEISVDRKISDLGLDYCGAAAPRFRAFGSTVVQAGLRRWSSGSKSRWCAHRTLPQRRSSNSDLRYRNDFQPHHVDVDRRP